MSDSVKMLRELVEAWKATDELQLRATVELNERLQRGETVTITASTAGQRDRDNRIFELEALIPQVEAEIAELNALIEKRAAEEP